MKILHELVKIRKDDRWTVSYRWVCSCGAMSAVRWSTKIYADRNHGTHVKEEQHDAGT